MTDIDLDELDGGRDRFERVHPSGKHGGNVWARATHLLFFGEQDGFEGIEDCEADGFDEGGGLGGEEIRERGWGSDHVGGVCGVDWRRTVFDACMMVCWWGIRMALFSNDNFIGFCNAKSGELSLNVGSLVVVDLMWKSILAETSFSVRWLIFYFIHDFPIYRYFR